jgi:hypothetical protein
VEGADSVSRMHDCRLSQREAPNLNPLEHLASPSPRPSPCAFPGPAGLAIRSEGDLRPPDLSSDGGLTPACNVDGVQENTGCRTGALFREAAGTTHFWWLVGAEFALAAVGAITTRTIGFFDSLLADRFSRHVSLMVMEHALRLDLASYEDPLFHDRLERARAQATDRVVMLQAIGSMGQQMVAAITLSLGVFWFSPWDLSGGEWQKIALARAYFRDAQVLILDEPTASLDARSESEVFQRFAELAEGKTALLISHRFSTVRGRPYCGAGDRQDCGTGKPRSVDCPGRRYAGMFELQASSYR